MKIDVDKNEKSVIFKCASVAEMKWIINRFMAGVEAEVNEIVEKELS